MWLPDAMIEFYNNNGQPHVLKAFQQCGLAGSYDGSEDTLTRVPVVDISELDLSM